MSNALLILNAGSSSLKFCVYRQADPPELILRGQIESLLTEPRFLARDATGKTLGQKSWGANSNLNHQGAVEFLLDWLKGQLGGLRVSSAGHRVVHGGSIFTEPVRVDDAVITNLESLIPLAPLHQPHNVEAIRAVSRAVPTLPQVACFDTSFHHTQPMVAQRFAIPKHLTESGVRRYGFHGLSYEYITQRLPQIDIAAATGRTVIAHLGNGASMCAVRNGVSIANTMGLTPLDGLTMGTRCGSIDPSVLIYLMDRHGMDARRLEKLLNYESGLLGVSGISSDMRTLLDREVTDPPAAEAVELFIYRITRELGSLTAALGGLDAIIFTGGIGEHAAPIRERVCRMASWLGVELDEIANGKHGPRISQPNSKVSVWVIPTNEELMIAQHMMRLLAKEPRA